VAERFKAPVLKFDRDRDRETFLARTVWVWASPAPVNAGSAAAGGTVWSSMQEGQGAGRRRARGTVELGQSNAELLLDLDGGGPA
jgi:hypothetical protein